MQKQNGNGKKAAASDRIEAKAVERYVIGSTEDRGLRRLELHRARSCRAASRCSSSGRGSHEKRGLRLHRTTAASTRSSPAGRRDALGLVTAPF